MTNDPYAYWRLALEGKRGNDLPTLHEGQPHCGFYRMSRMDRETKRKTYHPVAIWKEGDEFMCVVGSSNANAAETWNWCWGEPITEEVYRAVVGGADWPDIDPVVATFLRSGPPGAGHNNPPTDAAEILREQIEAAKAGVAEYREIKDDEKQVQAQTLRSRLLELCRQADKTREAEKRPHFDEAKKVDVKWMPLVKMAKEAADAIARAMSAWETKKAQAAAEARRKAEEEQRRQEEAARERDIALAESGVRAPGFAPPIEAAPPVATAPIRGAYGRAASVKVVKVVTEVTDQDALYRYFAKHDEVMSLLRTMAQKAVTLGHEVPGVKIEEERKVA